MVAVPSYITYNPEEPFITQARAAERLSSGSSGAIGVLKLKPLKVKERILEISMTIQSQTPPPFVRYHCTFSVKCQGTDGFDIEGVDQDDIDATLQEIFQSRSHQVPATL
jgi:hypothetical protein